MSSGWSSISTKGVFSSAFLIMKKQPQRQKVAFSVLQSSGRAWSRGEGSTWVPKWGCNKFYPNVTCIFIKIVKSMAGRKTWSRFKRWESNVCCSNIDYRPRVRSGRDRTKNTIPSKFLHNLSTMKILPSCKSDWDSRHAHWPDLSCNRIYSVQQGSDLLADNPINRKVKGVTQGFVILYLILTNKDRLLMELKLSGT